MEPGPQGKEHTADLPSKESVHVVGVCGSLVADSTTKKALAYALKGASELEVSTQLIDLRDYKLVLYGEVEEAAYPPDVFRLRKTLSEAHGIIFGTPEYYGSLTGALKNMFDLMGTEAFEGKVVGLVGVAGGHTGAINTLNTLRTIGRNLHCWVLPHEVSISESGKRFEPDGSVKDPALEERLLELGRLVARFAVLQQRIRDDAFIRLWEGLPRW